MTHRDKWRIVDDPHANLTLGDVVWLILSVAFLFSAILTYARWWQWKHGLVPSHVPVLWALVALLILAIAPNRPRVIVGASGACIFYGLKGVLLEQEPWAWVLIIGPIILSVAVCLLFPSAFLPKENAVKSNRSGSVD